MLQTITKTDAQIQKDVLAELHWDPRVEETEIGVQVKDGIVTLVGTVTSYARKIAAKEAAHRVAGVHEVADDIVVNPVGSGRPTDTDIAQAIHRTLEWDVLVPHDDIHATVSDGWVTLEGEVETWAQRTDAAEAIQRLNGVMGVANKLRARQTGDDPHSIRERIVEALERQAEDQARKIEVEVNDDIITLKGRVRTWSEKIAARKAVGLAPGVRTILDELIVDPHG